MTHIDPFAPADSPQHPANFYAEGQRSQTIRHEAMPPLLALADEPVWSDDPDAALTGQARWAEYAGLITEHGTEEEREAWDIASAAPPEENALEGYAYSVTEPTLADLRNRRDHPTPEQAPDTGAEGDDDLAQKLAALDEEDL